MPTPEEATDGLRIDVVQRAGLHVPRDISVLGFDGIALGRDLALELGTISQPNARIGHTAAQLLIDAIRGKFGNRAVELGLVFDRGTRPKR